jgi:ABC-type transport system involved in cytochrome c biogenesis permease subunit
MTLTFFNWGSVLCYLASVGCYAGLLIGRKPTLGKVATGLLLLGLGVHFVALFQRAAVTGNVPYSNLDGSASLFAWMMALVYIGLEARHKQKAMSLFLVPIVIVLQVISTVFFQTTPAETNPLTRGWLFAFHVNVNMFAYSAFTISFIASAMYLIQYWQLRARRPGRWLSLLPSLDLLERVNLTSVVTGVSALFVGIMTGAVWAQTAWGGRLLDAKIIVSLLALLIYSLYILLQKRKGWRGPRSAWVAVGGFAIVLMSYTVVNLFFSRLHAFF